MELYTIQNNKLEFINEKPFSIEREIQKLFEANLMELMNLELIRSEFSIKNKRIDTLAFDFESKAFIIIEYKRDKSISVIDQGFTYLSIMLENKAEFIIEYNEQRRENLKREDVDWSQTRVIFVSTDFTENQIQATNFKDLPIELYEIQRYENNTLSVRKISKSQSAASIKPLTQKTEKFRTVSAEVKVYTEEEHFRQASEATVELYKKFKLGILRLNDDIEVRPLRVRINFRKGRKIYADIALFKKALKIWINAAWGQLDDSRNIAANVSGVGHWGNGDYQIEVRDDKDLEYIMCSS